MKKTLKRIEPLRFGKILSVFCWGIMVIYVPIYISFAQLRAQFSSGYPVPLPILGDVILAVILGTIIIPIMYATLAFPAGIVAAWMYNRIAKLLGGVQIELEEINGAR